MSALITNVENGSLCQKAGIVPGDTVMAVNGHDIADVLDYRFYITDSRVSLKIKGRDGRIKRITLKKDEYDDIGLEFGTYLMDSKRSCRNGCVFCFIDQMPPGMRESLYFKDDDARLSFLMGNYVTLTNMEERDVSRIIEMHISPINVSVHTTNPELRVKMMRNKHAGESLKILGRLAEAGIKLNCQLVLCRGLNDGDELKRSLSDLGALFPSVESIAAVPVGLTRYREKLYPLEPFDRDSAAQVVRIMEDYGSGFLKMHGTRLVYAADEFYLKAGLKIPDADFYEDMSQLENGVGLMAGLESSFAAALSLFDWEKPGRERKVSIATGEAAAPFIERLAEKVCERARWLDCKVYTIFNDFFGRNVNVAGLVTGGDLVKQLEGKELGEQLLIPSVMLKQDEDIFLDDVTLDEVRKRLGVGVTAVENDGFALLDAMCGR